MQDSAESEDGVNLKGGLDEIDFLFCEKKKARIQTKEESESKKKKIQPDSKRVRKDSNSSSMKDSNSSWTDDGLGGKFNAEGYTGRVQDGCRIFKAHVLNKPSSGSTKDCPFECDCCFI